MQIDSEGTVAGQPTLIVRRALRKLRMATTWSAAELEAAAGPPAGRGRDFARRLRREGLVEGCGRGVWSVSQAGCAFAAATAAKRLTRATAERALAEFMERVALVNESPVLSRQSGSGGSVRQHAGSGDRSAERRRSGGRDRPEGNGLRSASRNRTTNAREVARRDGPPVPERDWR